MIEKWRRRTGDLANPRVAGARSNLPALSGALTGEASIQISQAVTIGLAVCAHSF